MKKIDDPDRTLLRGMSAVSKYTQYSLSTIRRWTRQHALPLGKLPDGTWVTSTELIDRWILARRPFLHEPRGQNAPARYDSEHDEEHDDEHEYEPE